MLELFIWILRLTMMGMMVLLLLFFVLSLRADLRAAGNPASREMPKPKTPAKPRKTTSGDQVSALAYTAGPQPATGRDFPLVGVLVIGREPACQVVIPGTTVSKHHARIFPQNGAWYAEDTNSTNGTLLNDAPLLTPTRLHPGDRLRIGETEFTLH
jgi:pSer/pThr/pTyr-binding forkhead associated (FHA) protein